MATEINGYTEAWAAHRHMDMLTQDWDGWVNQTPEEFMRISRLTDPDMTVEQAVREYVAEIPGMFPEYDPAAHGELQDIAAKLVAYIEADEACRELTAREREEDERQFLAEFGDSGDEPAELPVYRVTADEFVGIHHTGMQERRYTDVVIAPHDLADDEAGLEPTPENIEWWHDVLQALGDYKVLLLESRPHELEARARELEFESFEEWERYLEDEGDDLEREAELKRRFLGGQGDDGR
jgi:hypothetical protein